MPFSGGVVLDRIWKERVGRTPGPLGCTCVEESVRAWREEEPREGGTRERAAHLASAELRAVGELDEGPRTREQLRAGDQVGELGVAFLHGVILRGSSAAHLLGPLQQVPQQSHSLLLKNNVEGARAGVGNVKGKEGNTGRRASGGERWRRGRRIFTRRSWPGGGKWTTSGRGSTCTTLDQCSRSKYWPLTRAALSRSSPSSFCRSGGRLARAVWRTDVKLEVSPAWSSACMAHQGVVSQGPVKERREKVELGG